MKKIILTVLLAMSFLGKKQCFAQQIYLQNFENPAGTWTNVSSVVDAVGIWSGTSSPANSVWHGESNCTGWTSTQSCSQRPNPRCSATTPNGGNGTAHAAMFNVWDNTGNASGYIQSPAIDLSSYATPQCNYVNFSFYWFNYLNTAANTKIIVSFSADGGASFSPQATYTASASCGWNTSSIIVPHSFLTTTFVIKIACTVTGSDSYAVLVDEIKLESVPYTVSSVMTQTNVTCKNANNGMASIVPSGGQGSYTYAWGPSGGSSATATNLAPGIYTCTATDSYGCSSTGTVNITEPSASLAISVTSTSSVSCFGGNNGSATSSASGGTTSYSYSWTPSGGTSATGTNMAAGNYTVKVTDANGCIATATCTITQPATPVSASIVSSTSVTCNGGSTGSATGSATGGTGALTYSWSPSGGTGTTATNLSAGTYTFTATDANGCKGTATVTIAQPAAVTGTITSTSPSCNGGSNASATVTASGGSGPYTYTWNPGGQNTQTISGQSAGNYTCSIKDNKGCVGTATATIGQPTAITATITTTPANCGVNNGSASISAAGGTGAYTYSWSPSGGTAQVATSLGAGGYACTVKDANNCSYTFTTTVNNTGGITATVTAHTNVSCAGGSNGTATVTASGGTGSYTYSWSPSGGTAATASGLGANTFTCTVTDVSGCKAFPTVTITQPTVITITITPTNASCNGGNNGSAVASASGGTGAFTYTWSPSGGNSATASNLTAGTYTCTVKDANNCSSTATVTISQPSAITATVTPTNVTCNGSSNGSASVNASGGTGSYTYTWSPSGGNAASATNLSAGNYTCIIKDANLCAKTVTVTISQPSAISVSATGSGVNCNAASNGSATVTASGGTGSLSYAWSPSGGSAAIANNLSAGTYSCTVTDANGCSVTTTVSISQPAAISTTVSTTSATCNGASNGSAAVNASGGAGSYTYAWSPSGGNASSAINLSAGNYTCVITDANSCSVTAIASVGQPSVINVSISSTAATCNGSANGSATVSASGGTGTLSYAWSPSGGSAAMASGLSAGTYTCTVTDANSCSTSTTVVINEPTAITSSSSFTAATCGSTNGAASVSPSGGAGAYTYAWSSGGTTSIENNLGAGTYSCTITDANNCTDVEVISITNTNGPTVTVSGQTNVSCNGGSDGSAAVNASGGAGSYSYTWTPTGGNTATANGLSAGTYSCIVSDGNGCVGDASVNITEPSPMSVTVSPASTMCLGNSTVLSASGGVTYNWSPPAGLSSTSGSSVTASPTVTTTYTVLVTDANGCQNSDTTTVTVNGCTSILASSGASFDLQTYPNPNSGTFILSAVFGDSKHVVIELKDMLGETVLEIENRDLGGNYSKEINIEDMKSGIYFLSLKTSAGSQVKRIIKN